MPWKRAKCGRFSLKPKKTYFIEGGKAPRRFSLFFQRKSGADPLRLPDKECVDNSMYILYGLMIIVGLVAMYSLLNAGNPDSLLRLLYSNTAYDFWVAVGSSLTVFVLGFIVFYNRDREGFRQLVQLNADQIHEARSQGRSNEEIADSILAAMGSNSGYRYNLARKKLIIALSEFK